MDHRVYRSINFRDRGDIVYQRLLIQCIYFPPQSPQSNFANVFQHLLIDCLDLLFKQFKWFNNFSAHR